MIDITDKNIISREAMATGTIKLNKETIKLIREIATLNTAKFDPFKSLINGNTSFSIKRFDISTEYYDRRIVNSAADATAL